MKSVRPFSPRGVFFLSIVVLSLLALSCQYDYVSPSPGMIGIRLKTISDSTRIAFDPLNNFVIHVSEVEAVRSNSSRVVIYADPKAISRTTNTYNTLDTRARDSSLVIGLGYAPPGDYIGVNLLVDPGTTVVLHGYQQINVTEPEGFSPLLTFRAPFKVTESQATQIVLTLNLDSTLIHGAFEYIFRPYYYISSIE